jgi:uncharacterized protein (TIGR03437 family)
LRFASLLLALTLPASAAVTYTYDSAGRLIKVDYGNGSVLTYAYDNAGNLTSRTAQSPAGPVITSVRTAFAGPQIAQNTWTQINGTNLVPAATPDAGVIWSTAPSFASGQLPTQLGPISVTVNGNPAFIYFYCSAATSTVCTTDQINVLTPLDNTTGPVQVVVTNGSTPSAPFTVTMKPVVPAFLLFSSAGYIVATHLDNSLLGPTTLYPGSSTPAQPGEQIVLYGSGFGLPTAALTNGSATQSGSLPSLPVCTVGANPAQIAFAGLAGPGLYQINLIIPNNTPNGDNPVICTYGGGSTPSGDLITVEHP